MKQTIIAIVGSSGAGKTLAVSYLEEYGYPAIVSYTTRAKREGETDGVEHYFVDEKRMPQASEMLAYTKFGGYHYWTEKKQIDGQNWNWVFVYVIDEKGLLELVDKFDKEYNIVSVLIKRDVENMVSIPSERRKRDEGRLVIEESSYDFVIENNGTIEEFKNNLSSLIEKIDLCLQ